jgi:hypothetical protein
VSFTLHLSAFTRTQLYRRLQQAYASGSLKLVKRIHALLALAQGHSVSAGAEMLSLVAYPLAADNVLGLLPCRLRGVNQPVIRHSEQVFKTSSSPIRLPLDTHGTLNVTILHPG